MSGLVLATHVNWTEYTGAAVPVPVRVATAGELEALLANDAVAEAAPVAVGVNVTVNDSGWLVVTVTGNERPLIENSDGFVPPMVTEETVTLAPLAVKVPVCVPLVPSTTLPTLIGLLTANVPCAPTAEPLRRILKLGFSAFEETVTSPVKLPEDCGAKVTLNGTLCPDPSVTGKVIPETLNPVPLDVTAEISALEPPVLLTVSVCVELWPTVTFVNVRLVGLAVKVAGVTPFPDKLTSTAADPLTVNAISPFTVPAAVGEKLMLKVNA